MKHDAKGKCLAYAARGDPEFVPSYIEPHRIPVKEELLTPQAAPDGPIVTSLGVTCGKQGF
jgi:hypothetical protein